jgi:hypothetical protein
MKKIIVFSILLLSAMAVIVGTTITTTMQIQPAYSQATHCATTSPGFSACITPGPDASLTICLGGSCRSPMPVSPQIAGQSIGSVHKACGQERAECTVIPPNQ